jgi:hypothetical protein
MRALPIVLAAAGVVAALAAGTPAKADWDHDGWRHREWREHEWREHHRWGPGYGYYGYNPPPVVYTPPPVYGAPQVYAPPVYAPPPVIYSPGVTFGVHVP